MSVPLTLLGLLEREPSHGYDLKRDYDAYFGRGKPLPYGQVYATLSRLARDGMAIESWLAEPAAPEPHLQTVLFAKVVLSLMLDRPAAGYLDKQRAAHLQRMRELTALKQEGNLVDIMLADHGLYHLEADLRWIDHTIARLDALRKLVQK
jgi:hypothetical protein